MLKYKITQIVTLTQLFSDYNRKMKNKKRLTVSSVNRFLVFVVGTRIELVYHA